MPGIKGRTNNPAGKPKGLKRDPERQLLKNLFALEIIPKNREFIVARCMQIITTGKNEDFLSLLKTMQAGEPKAVEVTGGEGGPIEIKWPGV